MMVSYLSCPVGVVLELLTMASFIQLDFNDLSLIGYVTTVV